MGHAVEEKQKIKKGCICVEVSQNKYMQKVIKFFNFLVIYL